MLTNQEQLYMLRGIIASAPPEQQQRVAACAEKIHSVVAEFPQGNAGSIAVGLVTLELMVADDQKEEKG